MARVRAWTVPTRLLPALLVLAGFERTLWLSEGRQGESAALVVAGGHLLILATEGRLVVAKLDAPRFAAVATYTVARARSGRIRPFRDARCW